MHSKIQNLNFHSKAKDFQIYKKNESSFLFFKKKNGIRSV